MVTFWVQVIGNATGAFVSGFLAALFSDADVGTALIAGGSSALAVLAGLFQQKPTAQVPEKGEE